MASQKLVFAPFLHCVLVILFMISSSNGSSNGSAKAVFVSVNSSLVSDKVTLSLYYEAMCPYCANFMVNYLVKVLELKDLHSIINLRLVPWGNAVIRDDKSWVCQHGPDECQLNTMEACAINVWPDLETHFRFILCVERLHLQNRHTDWQSCFATERLDPKPIADCYNNGHGYRLELAYADETARLNPPHQFVPWVVVNNQPLKENYQNFVANVCNAYKGTNIPEACKQHTIHTNSSEKVNSTGQVCHAGEAKNFTSMATQRKKSESPNASLNAG